MFQKFFNCFADKQAGTNPEDAGAEPGLSGGVLKQTPTLRRAILKLEVVLHHENNIEVVWFRLRCDVTAEDNKASNTPGSFCQVMDVEQMLRANEAWPCGGTKAFPDFVERSVVEARRQVTVLVERRQWHFTNNVGYRSDNGSSQVLSASLVRDMLPPFECKHPVSDTRSNSRIITLSSVLNRGFLGSSATQIELPSSRASVKRDRTLFRQRDLSLLPLYLHPSSFRLLPFQNTHTIFLSRFTPSGRKFAVMGWDLS